MMSEQVSEGATEREVLLQAEILHRSLGEIEQQLRRADEKAIEIFSLQKAIDEYEALEGGQEVSSSKQRMRMTEYFT
jgi:SpoVK/Ycf46/Vps4 family AAA+-type ATPase